MNNALKTVLKMLSCLNKEPARPCFQGWIPGPKLKDAKEDKMIPEVDKEKCLQCGECVIECPQGVFDIDEQSGDVHVENPDNCVGCEQCTENCPGGAITIC